MSVNDGVYERHEDNYQGINSPWNKLAKHLSLKTGKDFVAKQVKCDVDVDGATAYYMFEHEIIPAPKEGFVSKLFPEAPIAKIKFTIDRKKGKDSVAEVEIKNAYDSLNFSLTIPNGSNDFPQLFEMIEKSSDKLKLHELDEPLPGAEAVNRLNTLVNNFRQSAHKAK